MILKSLAQSVSCIQTFRFLVLDSHKLHYHYCVCVCWCKFRGSICVILLNTIRSPCIRACALLSAIWVNLNNAQIIEDYLTFYFVLIFLLLYKYLERYLNGTTHEWRSAGLWSWFSSTFIWLLEIKPRLPGFGARVFMIKVCFHFFVFNWPCLLYIYTVYLQEACYVLFEAKSCPEF